MQLTDKALFRQTSRQCVSSQFSTRITLALGCFQLSENCSLKNLIPFDSWIKDMNECNGHSKITQKYDSDWILLIPFDSTNQMVYLKKVVTYVTAKFCFGDQKESVIQLMLHSFMVNQITEWMILNWKQPSRVAAALLCPLAVKQGQQFSLWRQRSTILWCSSSNIHFPLADG